MSAGPGARGADAEAVCSLCNERFSLVLLTADLRVCPFCRRRLLELKARIANELETHKKKKEE